MVVVLEAVVLLGVVGLVVYATIRLLASAPTHPAVRPGRWRVVHYDASGETRVVLLKVTDTGAKVDEHLIAAVAVDDTDYDAKFLAAMSLARERRALFEAEDDG